MKSACILALLLILFAKGSTACTNHPPYAWAELIVPEIQFKEAPLVDVASFFNAFMARSLTNQPAPRISLAPDLVGIPPITFTASHIHIGCAIKIISSVCGLAYKPSESGIDLHVMTLKDMKLEGGKNLDPKASTADDPFAVAPSRKE